MTERSVCVLILNWNGLADTLECIASVQQSDYSNFSVIVVDNGSLDDSVVSIRRAYPEIELIANRVNLGWAGGNNVGIQIALERAYDYVFLLNNDTVIAEDCLSLMMASIAKVGPCLLHPAIYYYSEPLIPQLDPVAGIPSADRSSAIEMDFAYGAAMLIPRCIFQHVGVFDEKFFLQLEETDFYLRSRKLGFKSLAIPCARVLHKESRSFGGKRTPVKMYYTVRNTLLLTVKHSTGIRDFVWSLKKLYWTICQAALLQADAPQKSRLSGVRWIFSCEKFARATRGGILDFLTLRFGSISDRLRNRIS